MSFRFSKFILLYFLLSHQIAVSQNHIHIFDNFRGYWKDVKTGSEAEKIQASLKLGDYYLYLPGQEKKDLDSALYYARKARELSAARHEMLETDYADELIGTAYVEARDMEGMYRAMRGMSDSARVEVTLAAYAANFNHNDNNVYRYSHGDNQNLDSAKQYVRLINAYAQRNHSVHWRSRALALEAEIANLEQDTANFHLRSKQSVQLALEGNDLILLTWLWDFMMKYAYTDPVTAHQCDMVKERIYNLIDQSQRLSNIRQCEYVISALFDVATNLVLHGYPDQTVGLLEKEILLSKANNYVDTKVHELLADRYLTSGKLTQALGLLLEVQRLVEADGLDATPYTGLANIYRTLGNNELVLANTRKAIDIIHRKGSYASGLNIHYMVSAYLNVNQTEQAMKFLNEETKHAGLTGEAVNYPMFVARAFGNCYLKLHQWKACEESYLKYLTLGRQIWDLHKVTAYVHLGNLYVQMQDYRKAKLYLDSAVEGNKTAHLYTRYLRDTYLNLFKVDSARNDYRSAVTHLRLYQALNDSLFSDTKNKQLEVMRFEFETEKKDQDIALLTNKDKLQKAELQQAFITRNSLIGGTIMLVALLGLTYNRYRTKQRNNLQLQHKQKEINQTNDELVQMNQHQVKLISEKEWLVKEMHHRVKNNLQIVISLLNMQTKYLDDEQTLQAFTETTNRIQTISLIHQRLYRVENTTIIHMREYIQELLTYLKQGATDSNRIRFETTIDDIDLEITQSVPVGLLLNEIVTNSLKYAFVDQANGIVSVSLHQNNGRVSLSVSDNGIGIPKDFDTNNKSLGMKLIRTLVEQLEGELTIQNDKGTAFLIQFQKTSTVVETNRSHTT